MKTSAISRRKFLRMSTTGAAVVTATPAIVTTEALAAMVVNAAKKKAQPACEGGGCCITPSHDFYNVERGDPLPYKLPIEKQREIGMVRETWQLEIIADQDSNSKIERPL
jgi:hypothetical protein